MIGALIAGVDIVTMGAFLAALAYVVDRIMDARGWSRSSKNLRRENQDLVRRNSELEDTVTRHEEDIERLRSDVDMLRERNGHLEKTNLAAALEKLAEHEASAQVRHRENALRGEQSLAQGQQMLELLSTIRDTLRER